MYKAENIASENTDSDSQNLIRAERGLKHPEIRRMGKVPLRMTDRSNIHLGSVLFCARRAHER